MCLGIPGKIISIYSKTDLLMGILDFNGVRREVCLAYVPGAKIGDFALIHVGFALSIIDEEEAMATIELIKNISEVDPDLVA
jgi:hydrogenase expression/formation protein HypC